MSLIRQLSRIIDREAYNGLTFYVNGVPIITVEFHTDKEVTMLMNDMKKLRLFDGRFPDDIDTFRKKIETALVYNGIDELLKELKVMNIKFYAERYIDGEIMPNKIVINRGDADVDENGQEFVLFKRYEITGAIELTSHTLADIITAFAVPHYL